MEAVGKINQYICEQCCAVYTTVNLNAGNPLPAIPCQKCGGNCPTEPLKLTRGNLTCKWAWFRPTVQAYRRLPIVGQLHVLNGGLLIDSITDVESLQEICDVSEIDVGRDINRWFAYVLRTYQPDADVYAEACKSKQQYPAVTGSVDPPS